MHTQIFIVQQKLKYRAVCVCFFFLFTFYISLEHKNVTFCLKILTHVSLQSFKKFSSEIIAFQDF